MSSPLTAPEKTELMSLLTPESASIKTEKSTEFTNMQGHVNECTFLLKKFSQHPSTFPGNMKN